MKLMLILACMGLSGLIHAQNVSIIPKPVSAELGKGVFQLSAATKIRMEGNGLEKSAHFLNQYLQKYYGFTLATTTKPTTGPSVVLNFERMDYPLPGAYRLEIKKGEVYISGDNEAGVFYGIQSLIQLLPVQPSPVLNLPYIKIEDHPRFEYRGLHLDVGRHFFPVEYIKKYIDYIALHKMNYFHWHLTEDQGWRIQIKKYPLLTETGSCRAGTVIGRNTPNYDSTRYCGFYTQDEIREVIRYAADRYITIIPEIEMPGHASAALTAYPYLGCTGGPYQVQQRWGVFRDVFCAGNDSTFQFLQDVLDEVMALFPSRYIHIGGDECPKDRWKTCPKCQQRIRDNHLQGEHELQSYFIRRIEKYLNSKGRALIGWDEILEGGLAPKATVMSWRGEQGGIDAAKQNHDVVMTPGTYVYFDHAQKKNEDSITIGGYLPIEKVYSYEPVPAVLASDQAKHILGAQANVWTEYISNPAKLEYMLFPRLSALSEVLWSAKEQRDWKDFSIRLETQFKRYDLWKTQYSRAIYDLKTSILPSSDHHGVLWKLESVTDPKKSAIYYTISHDGGTSPEDTVRYEYQEPILIKNNGTYRSALYLLDASGKPVPGPLSSMVQSFHLSKCTGKKISLVNPPLDNFPGNGGAFGLINGALSPAGINSFEWMGWQDADLVAVIDLDQPTPIASVNIHVLDQNQARFYKPSSLEVFRSENGVDFTSLGRTEQFLPEKDNMGYLKVQFAPIQARYIKLIAKNPGVIPEGQPGAGNHARILVDEIGMD